MNTERSIVLRPGITIEKRLAGKGRIVSELVNRALVLARAGSSDLGEESPMSQHIRGIFYYLGIGDQDHLEIDYAEAVKWFRKAAERGHAEAQFNLGICYDRGRGLTEDPVEALEWFKKAAQQCFAKAQYAVGYCYRQGRGVQRNDAEGADWYRLAAEQGLPEAQHGLGICYAHGLGVAQNLTEATSWYRMAAEQDWADAQYQLGRCYRDGRGVSRNVLEAYNWFQLAGDKGKKEAVALELLLSAAELEVAKRNYQKFKVEHTKNTP